LFANKFTKGENIMRWFYNLRIRTKLLTSFFLVALFILIVGIAGMVNTRKINSNLNNIYNNDLLSVKTVGDIKTNIITIRADTLQLLDVSN
jgi:methyl-accepting chemotaxis protein